MAAGCSVLGSVAARCSIRFARWRRTAAVGRARVATVSRPAVRPVSDVRVVPGWSSGRLSAAAAGGAASGPKLFDRQRLSQTFPWARPGTTRGKPKEGSGRGDVVCAHSAGSQALVLASPCRWLTSHPARPRFGSDFSSLLRSPPISSAVVAMASKLILPTTKTLIKSFATASAGATHKFVLPKLSYAYSALEPAISGQQPPPGERERGSGGEDTGRKGHLCSRGLPVLALHAHRPDHGGAPHEASPGESPPSDKSTNKPAAPGTACMRSGA